MKAINENLIKSEKRLTEMTTYVRSLKGEIFAQERELSNLSPVRKKKADGTEEDEENGAAS